ncbi:hypothetical protein [Bacillus cereus group sp. BfR-BA-01380]|uniref:hypothetical protein n=1 Tax=Bacillus cereus group sp. BfR-BA-01380 TaxID=2920324 RepID=UPI001F58F796|nr:hypothetical protein [Bacillus cereus group sp. BfR-BA-01380]
MKTIHSYLFSTLILIILCGCNMNQKNKEQQIVDKAKETTINYFKEKQDLDVIITGYDFAPKDFQTVFIYGHVKDDKSKSFTADVEYGGGKYRIGSMSRSENLKLKN